jgi:hypothetical protein
MGMIFGSPKIRVIFGRKSPGKNAGIFRRMWADFFGDQKSLGGFGRFADGKSRK